MDGRMDKKQVIQTTIGVLSEISVPVRLKAQIADPIDGAINNLAIVLQMIQMEEEANANARRQEEEPETVEREIGSGEEELPEPGMEPLVLMAKNAGHPEEEAAEDGR